MSKSAFNKIMAGLEDAIAYTEGDTSRARVVEPVDIKAIREASGMSQKAFATTYHLPYGTVRDWEQNRRQPDAPARALLHLIRKNPQGVAKMLEDVPPL